MPSQKDTIEVLLVDDHSLVRRSFRRLLEDEPGLVVVGEASDGQEAVKIATALQPAVVVMDFALPKLTGAAAAQQILEAAPHTSILIVSMHSEPVYVRASFDVGARGYLLKSAQLDLAAAVRAVAAGRTVLAPSLSPPLSASGEAARPFTNRKLEVLRLIAAGHSTKQIAAKLGLSPGTVAIHRANIMAELAVNKSAKVSLYAVARGLLEKKSKSSSPSPPQKRSGKKKPQ
jgi:DNA-binding NarL/FixJ family response regulator